MSAHQRNTIRLELLRSRRPASGNRDSLPRKCMSRECKARGQELLKEFQRWVGELDWRIGDGKESPNRDVSSHIFRGEFGSENISSERVSRVIKPIPIGETEAQRGPTIAKTRILIGEALGLSVDPKCQGALWFLPWVGYTQLNAVGLYTTF